MAGLRDLYGSVKGQVSKGFDIAREKSADAFESVSSRLRGAPAQPEGAPRSGTFDTGAEARAAAAEADYNAKVNAFNQRASGGQPAQAPRPDQMAPRGNPNVGPGRPSAEATAYRASQGAAADVAEAAPKGLRGLGRALGPGVVAATEGYNVGKTVLDPSSTGTDMLRETGRSALRGGMTLLGGAAGAAGGSLLAPGPGTVVGGAAGGAAGYALGDRAANYIFGPAKGAAPAVQPAQPAAAAPAVQPAQPAAAAPARSDLIPTTDGGNATPEAMIGYTGIRPAPGYGAVKRTTPGNEGPAIKVGSGLRDSESARPGGFQAPAILAGVASRIANVKAAQARDSGKVAEAELGIKQANAGIAAQRLGMEMGQQNRKNIAARVQAEAGRDPAILGLEKPDQRKSAIDQRASEVTARLEHSFGQRDDGVTLDNATPAQVTQALLGEKFRQAVEKGRGDKVQWAVDFVGDKRHDSDNVFSYLPAYRDGTRVYTANGNSMSGARAQGRGDGVVGWSPFGPNDPVDADMQRYLRELPTKEQYEASLKKGK